VRRRRISWLRWRTSLFHWVSSKYKYL